MPYSKTPCPCQPCKPPERYPGCHAKCSKFAQWRELEDAARNAIVSERCLDSALNDLHCRSREAKSNHSLRKHNHY